MNRKTSKTPVRVYRLNLESFKNTSSGERRIVAALAGVSPGTVHKLVSGREVRESILERLARAAVDAGFNGLVVS